MDGTLRAHCGTEKIGHDVTGIEVQIRNGLVKLRLQSIDDIVQSGRLQAFRDHHIASRFRLEVDIFHSA